MDITSLSPKEQLSEGIKEKVKNIEARIRENDAIISQNQLEVDRLQSQAANANTLLQQVKNQMESLPREDIVKGYEKAMDVRSRLVSMRSQLEKLQDVQVYLHEFKDKLNEILGQLGGVAMDRLPSGPQNFELSLAGEQVVRILNAQESERRHMATGLHDGPTQSLSNFILQAEICQRLFDRDPATASVELNNLKAAANVTFQKMRDYIFELRPMMLDDLGLVATLRRHTENYSQKYEDKHFQFHLTGPGDNRRFPSYVEVMMFRCIQTLMTNSHQTLNAKNIEVKLDVDDTRLFGVIEDDGRFVNTEVELDPSQGSSPLHNILDLRERVEMIGGKVEFFSTEGEGNIAEVTLPYDAAEVSR